MRKKVFVFIVVLMSISLLGVIIIQAYWIRNAFKNKQQRFESDVTIALASTCELIKNDDEHKFYNEYQTFFKNDAYRKKSTVKSFLFQQIDTTKQQKFTFGSTVLEENFKIPIGFLNNDSIILKRFSGREDYYSAKITKGGIQNKDFLKETDESEFSVFRNYPNWEKQQIKDVFSKIQNRKPITKRLQNSQLNAVLKRELLKRNVKLPYHYAVYKGKTKTSIYSKGFTSRGDDFRYPLFDEGKDGNIPYRLYVNFSGERRYLLSGIGWILLLSVLFIIIIITTFSSSLYQLIRQKKIAQIKTDFINNMTHEFKTPIATINLALDAIKNPKVIGNQNSVKRYIRMIKEENKRMLRQVENVLQISRLEKKQEAIPREPVVMHKIIEEALAHISLLISDRKGTISTYFEAKVTRVLGNSFHLTNVVVNMLENAIKYSKGKPEITITTENTIKFFIFKIKDQGIGMSKNTQKHAFDKFFRAQKGDIHNVKGHGLGLTYVKEVIDHHQGIINIEGEKGKGSIFIVKIPLI